MKILSKEFVVRRTKATRDAQAALINPPYSFVWEKTVPEWTDIITLQDQLESAEILARTEWRNAAEAWQADLDTIKEITRDVAGYGVVKFRNDAVKLPLFERLRTDGRSRPDIYRQGKSARDAWAKAEGTWVIKKKDSQRQLSELSSLIAASESRDNAHGAKETAWKLAVSALNGKVREANGDCLNWYADATRYFAAGTTAGDMIRSSVPTTTRPEAPVGQAVISNVMVSGGDIHFDADALHGTKFTYLHQAPGAQALVVVVTDSPEKHLTLHGQAPGLHRFKVIPSNSRGEGAASVVVEVMVGASAVA